MEYRELTDEQVAIVSQFELSHPKEGPCVRRVREPYPRDDFLLQDDIGMRLGSTGLVRQS
jgi:hypothetical protein